MKSTTIDPPWTMMIPQSTCLGFDGCWTWDFLIDRLEEAEERYNNRDSRPEDLELIQQLRDAIAEREARMKQLIVSCCLGVSQNIVTRVQELYWDGC